MAELISAEELPSTLDHLVEAWHDRAHARQAFDRYRSAVKEPRPPPSFGDVPELIAHNQQKERYQEGLAIVQVEMEASHMHYVEIARKVEQFLPPYNPLRYAYQGERDEFKDKHFVILKTRARRLLSSPAYPAHLTSRMVKIRTPEGSRPISFRECRF
jgi:hypothetical protein